MTDGSVVEHPAARLVGAVVAEWDMPIELGKIREFARATGNRAAAYRVDGAPIPPTFLQVATLWEPEDLPPLVVRLGLDLPLVLNGGQEYRFIGELPRAGQRLQVRRFLESVTSKRGRRGGAMTVLVVLTEYTDEHGDLVAEGRTTLIERARPPPA